MVNRTEASMTRPTQGERLARIETLLETYADAIHNNGETAEKVFKRLDELDAKWTSKFEGLETVVRDDVADLAALKNTGKGALGVASLVFTAVGAFVMALWDSFKGALFH